MSQFAPVAEELRTFGFRLSDEFVAQEQSAPSTVWTQAVFRQHLLKSDLRRAPCVTPYFPPELTGARTTTSLTGPVVLQVVSVANVSLPNKRKFEDSSDRLLSLTLTDGHSKVHALEIERIQDLKSSSPPGTKVLYRGGAVIQGKLFLTNKNCQFLGGEVSHLMEAHVANINAQKFRSLSANAGVKAVKGGAVPPKFEFKLISAPSSATQTAAAATAQGQSTKPTVDKKSSVETRDERAHSQRGDHRKSKQSAVSADPVPQATRQPSGGQSVVTGSQLNQQQPLMQAADSGVPSKRVNAKGTKGSAQDKSNANRGTGPDKSGVNIDTTVAERPTGDRQQKDRKSKSQKVSDKANTSRDKDRTGETTALQDSVQSEMAALSIGAAVPPTPQGTQNLKADRSQRRQQSQPTSQPPQPVVGSLATEHTQQSLLSSSRRGESKRDSARGRGVPAVAPVPETCSPLPPPPPPQPPAAPVTVSTPPSQAAFRHKFHQQEDTTKTRQRPERKERARRGSGPEAARPSTMTLSSLLPTLPLAPSGQTWMCSRCAFANHAVMPFCEMCSQPK